MYYTFSFIFGLLIGSFLNCLIWRLYKDESLWGRSYCPKCRHQIAWYDNIPLLSFLLLKGKCRHCHDRISWQYPLVEFVAAILFTLSYHQVGVSNGLLLAFNWILISSLLVIFIYDFRWQLVPMNFLWPMTAIIFILQLFLGVHWDQLLIWGGVAFLFFFAQYVITKHKGIGDGDMWIGLLLGFSFPNPQYLFIVLLVSYFIGASVGIMLITKKGYSGKSAVPLGPFLVIGALVALLYGPQILAWYFGLF